MGEVGNYGILEPPLNLDYGCNIRIGDCVYTHFNLTILDCSLVTIGHRTLFGPSVSIFAGTQETDVQRRRASIELARPVHFGDDRWIGGHSVTLPGVSIGEGCTIAAGSVGTKDIPPWSVAMGVPT